MLGYIVLLFSLPNYARSVGLSAHQGSVVGAVLNLGQGRSYSITMRNKESLIIPGMGRPFVGYFSDAAGRINLAGACTFLAGLFCLVIVCGSFSSLIICFRRLGYHKFQGLVSGYLMRSCGSSFCSSKPEYED
jgi:MFS family permease